MKPGELANLRLLQGHVMGLLWELESFDLIPTQVESEVDDNGDYTGRLFITRDSGVYVLTVEPFDDT